LVSRRNRSEHVRQTLSTSRRRSTIQCREVPAGLQNELRQSAAADFSRLTERQAGTLRASALQAEARCARLAIERLRWQLSCPPPPRLAGSYHSLNTAATAGRIATRPALSDFQPLPQTAAALSAIQIRCGLTRQSDALLPCPFSMGFHRPRC